MLCILLSVRNCQQCFLGITTWYMKSQTDYTCNLCSFPFLQGCLLCSIKGAFVNTTCTVHYCRSMYHLSNVNTSVLQESIGKYNLYSILYRLLNISNTSVLLELACGDGYFLLTFYPTILNNCFGIQQMKIQAVLTFRKFSRCFIFLNSVYLFSSVFLSPS